MTFSLTNGCSGAFKKTRRCKQIENEMKAGLYGAVRADGHAHGTVAPSPRAGSETAEKRAPRILMRNASRDGWPSTTRLPDTPHGGSTHRGDRVDAVLEEVVGVKLEMRRRLVRPAAVGV